MKVSHACFICIYIYKYISKTTIEICNIFIHPFAASSNTKNQGFVGPSTFTVGKKTKAARGLSKCLAGSDVVSDLKMHQDALCEIPLWLNTGTLEDLKILVPIQMSMVKQSISISRRL